MDQIGWDGISKPAALQPVDEEPPAQIAAVEKKIEAADPRRQSPYGMFPIGSEGGMLMPYEVLINPQVVNDNPLSDDTLSTLSLPGVFR